MIAFLYLLAALGVAYWAKVHDRNPALWFALSIALTPLGGALAIRFADRWFSARRP